MTGQLNGTSTLNFFCGFLRGYDSATRPTCQESSAVPGSRMGQRLAVNSFTVYCSIP
jgi:hypothetical protein